MGHALAVMPTERLHAKRKNDRGTVATDLGKPKRSRVAGNQQVNGGKPATCPEDIEAEIDNVDERGAAWGYRYCGRGKGESEQHG
jgi:hypothetical protein